MSANAWFKQLAPSWNELCYDSSARTMRSALVFIFHLAIALLVAPMLTFFSSDVAYWVARSYWVATARATSSQQFYSDHLLVLASVTGLLLGYFVCGEITSRSAVWVWVPVVIAFAIRIAVWFSTGSVLLRESVIAHFITADCQINGWRDVGYSTHCADKMLLMPAILGSVAYSVGAVLQRFVAQRHRADAIS